MSQSSNDPFLYIIFSIQLLSLVDIWYSYLGITMFNVESLFDDSEADHLFSVIQNETSFKYFLNPLKNKAFVIVSFDK